MLDTTTYLLTALHRAHLAALAPRLLDLGLHPGAELLLAEISRHQGATQVELAERLAVKAPSVTKVLRNLERDGLVERLGDPEDARVLRVHLTPTGSRVLSAARDTWLEAERETLSALPDRERATLHRLLARAARK